MINLQYLRFILDESDTESYNDLLREYCALRGFESCIFQPTISSLNTFDKAFVDRLHRMEWRDFDIAQWLRYGFDRQADIVQLITSSSTPFSFTLDELEPHWHKRRDFTVIKQLFKRRGILSGIVVPLHLAKHEVAYSVWLSQQSYDLNPFIENYKDELESLCRSVQNRFRKPELYKAAESIGLSQKEWQCLSLAALGYTEKEMAEKLTRSADTVKFHLRNAAKKLNAKNRTEAVAKAIKLGVIHPKL